MPGRRDTYINMWQIFIVLENSLQKANKKHHSLASMDFQSNRTEWNDFKVGDVEPDVLGARRFHLKITQRESQNYLRYLLLTPSISPAERSTLGAGCPRHNGSSFRVCHHLFALVVESDEWCVQGSKILVLIYSDAVDLCL